MLYYISVTTEASRLRIKFPPITKSGRIKMWNEMGGYKEAILLALPLILSSSSTLILQLIDRLFLTWYSPLALAGSSSAGMMAWTLQSFFIAVFGYTAVFVAQYNGAKKHNEIGRAHV